MLKNSKNALDVSRALLGVACESKCQAKACVGRYHDRSGPEWVSSHTGG